MFLRSIKFYTTWGNAPHPSPQVINNEPSLTKLHSQARGACGRSFEMFQHDCIIPYFLTYVWLGCLCFVLSWFFNGLHILDIKIFKDNFHLFHLTKICHHHPILPSLSSTKKTYSLAGWRTQSNFVTYQSVCLK